MYLIRLLPWVVFWLLITCVFRLDSDLGWDFVICGLLMAVLD